MSKCKITVLRRLVHQDLVDEYMEPDIITRPCPVFAEGQEFIVDDHPGEDFCDAAWNDLFGTYQALRIGASFAGWSKNENALIRCCTSGIRPVIFNIERIDD